VAGSETRAFDRLEEQQQRCCIDVAVAVAVIGSRVPAFGKEAFDKIVSAFATSAGVEPNISRYALRDVTDELFYTSWEFHVTKEGPAVATQFMKRKEPVGGNGEAHGSS
jgi:hypothetical protein